MKTLTVFICASDPLLVLLGVNGHTHPLHMDCGKIMATIKLLQWSIQHCDATENVDLMECFASSLLTACEKLRKNRGMQLMKEQFIKMADSETEAMHYMTEVCALDLDDE